MCFNFFKQLCCKNTVVDSSAIPSVPHQVPELDLSPINMRPKSSKNYTEEGWESWDDNTPPVSPKKAAVLSNSDYSKDSGAGDSRFYSINS